MRLTFIRLYMEPETKSGGFSEIELKQMEGSLTKIVDGKLKPITEWQNDRDKADNENQKALDDLLVKVKELGTGGSVEKKNFGEVFSHEIKSQFESRADELEEFEKTRKGSFIVELKTVGDMTTANLTGNGVTGYNQRAAIVPAQRSNLRDFIPTVQTDTGSYVTFRESGSEGGFGVQTEAAAKSLVDYDFTEDKKIPGFIAGLARFSKQYMKNLPFMQTTLPRLLTRDFYKKENSYFWGIAAGAATGTTTSTETNDVKQLIDVLAARLDTDYNNSVILMKNVQVARMLKLLYDDHNYFGAAGVVATQNGVIYIMGTPVVGVSFAQSGDKAMILDNDFVERIEGESLRLEFSFEDSDNFQKNMVTARLECFETLNVMRGDAVSYLDFGNSASS